MANGVTESLDARVEALLARGERAAAVAACEAAGTGVGRVALVDAAALLADAEESDAAIRLLRKGNTRYPKSGLILHKLASTLGDVGRSAEAIPVYEELVEVSTTDFGKEQAWSLTLLGIAYRRAGRLDDAVKTLRRAIEVDPEWDEGHLNLGAALYQQGDLAGAEESIRAGLEIDPKYPEAHYNLALILADRDEVGEALRHFERAVALKPDFGRAHAEYGRLLYSQGAKFKKTAVRHLKRAVELDAAGAWTHLYLGDWHWTCRRLDEALESFTAASQVNPDEPMALVCMADIHQVRRQWDKALSLCERALELNPEFEPAMQNIAECWIRKDDLRTARRYVEAIAAAPGERSAYYLKVRALLEEREEAADAEGDEWAELADEDLKPVKRRW